MFSKSVFASIPQKSNVKHTLNKVIPSNPKIYSPNKFSQHIRFFSTADKSQLASLNKISTLTPPSVLAWDLDDTIWDCLPHYRHCINATRTHMRLASWSEDDFNKFGYQSIEHMFNIMFGMDQSKAAQDYFYKAFALLKPDQKLLLPNVLETLQQLSKLDLKMVVVSNLEEFFAESLLDGFDIRKYFDAIVVKKEGQPQKPDPKALLAALEKIDIAPGKHVWMIGDSLRYDMQCAAAAGCTGILYKNLNSMTAKHNYPIEPCAVVDNHGELSRLVAMAKKQESHVSRAFSNR